MDWADTIAHRLINLGWNSEELQDAIAWELRHERDVCTKIIEDNVEGSHGSKRVLIPRTEGNLAGIGYADAIRARSTAA